MDARDRCRAVRIVPLVGRQGTRLGGVNKALIEIGGRRVIDGTLTTGEFAAFYTYVLMLAGPMRMLGRTERTST